MNNSINRAIAVIESHSNIVREMGDVYYDADDKIVEVNESLVQAYIHANDYRVQRRIAYPSIVDQLDTLYHGGYDAWKATIKQVKDDIPKP